MIDSHAHLDMIERPTTEVVADAEHAGVHRVLTIGIDGSSCRAALQLAEDFPQVRVAIGRHPNAAAGFDDADRAELAALAAHHDCAAIGETGLDYYREGAPKPDQARAFTAQLELARELDKPVVIHTRAAEDDTLDLLATHADGLRVILHCFSMPDRLDECLARGYWISFAGNVTFPKAPELREAAARVPADRLLVETDSPFLAPQPVRGKPNEPRHVVATARVVAEAPRRPLRRARGRRRAQRRRAVRVVSRGRAGPAEPAPAARVRHHAQPRAGPELPHRLQPARGDRARREARPRRRRAGDRRRPWRPFRVPGRARAHVHVVEVDPRLEPALHDALDAHPNATLHIADALDLDYAALDPAPTKVVANLPYGIAATAILRTLEQLPSATRWVVMVQREVGERMAADPAGSAYGIPSVLAQLAGDVARRAPRLSHRVLPRAERRLRAGRARSARGPAPTPPRARSSRAPSRTGARRWPARSRSPAPTARTSATAPAPRSRTWACPPTSAPSA